MDILKDIYAFFEALPALIKLFQVLQKRIDEAEIERKVGTDVKAIHEAFSAKDPKKLNDLFNSAN